jgi:hypothetical protein
MRRTLGTAVFAGMIGVTMFGIFLTPVFYSVVRRFSGRTPGEPALPHVPDAARARQAAILLDRREANLAGDGKP